MKKGQINVRNQAKMNYRKDSCISRTFLLKFWAKKSWLRLIHKIIAFKGNNMACMGHKLY